MSKLSLFYALLSAENKGIQLVHISWIIISLCKIVCNTPMSVDWIANVWRRWAELCKFVKYFVNDV